ncbi:MULTISPECIES: cell division topological specificity factor MinE [Azospirillaceae]|jgi:cell division topological specificity factor|uniref:cell division topological specificity factor MinE n=1 Tax=Azospirillaceae TaxID=2829815 RepID=UPI000B6EE6E3|nr:MULTISPECIES: cell division topological specificity factor MinE [Azospirillaceae]MDG5495498.1 cell division topological specificity factor MinE [Niveispirillum sp. BGYR6]SNS28834.1 cell division topological specificity factor MinE [Azospirillum sp. RU38E]SNS47316.1 cell division topological specificity factor MinE [Azospirillum sp. RU37A]
MNLLDIFKRSKPPTIAAQAKERLQIVLAHERSDRNSPDFLPALQQELLAVIKKYVSVDEDKVAVKLERESGCSMLEVNVELPSPAARAAAAAAAAAKGKPAPAN